MPPKKLTEADRQFGRDALAETIRVACYRVAATVYAKLSVADVTVTWKDGTTVRHGVVKVRVPGETLVDAVGMFSMSTTFSQEFDLSEHFAGSIFAGVTDETRVSLIDSLATGFGSALAAWERKRVILES